MDTYFISITMALKRLSAAGIDADYDDNIRAVAGNSGKLPIDIVNIILGETKQINSN